MLGSQLHGAAEPAASVSLAGWALALRTQDRLLGDTGGQAHTRQCPHHHPAPVGRALPRSMAQLRVSLQPVPSQPWCQWLCSHGSLQRWHVRARLDLPEFLSRESLCGAGMCLKPLGGLMSPANISQTPSLSLSYALAFKSDKLNLWNYFI